MHGAEHPFQLGIRNSADEPVQIPGALLEDQSGGYGDLLPGPVLARARPPRLKNEPVQAQSARLHRTLRRNARAAAQTEPSVLDPAERLEPGYDREHWVY